MQNKLPMKNFVLDLLKNNLPKFYYYHNCEHTLYVQEKAIEIAQHENCTEKEIDLISTAALWHDTGFIHIYINHEDEGCVLVRKYLPGFGYNEEDIAIICGMIMATKIPQSPTNKLEEIIADADLEYFGSPGTNLKATTLFKELHYLDKTLTKEKWTGIQIAFLQQHHYFTSFCKQNRDPEKQKYLEELIKSQ